MNIDMNTYMAPLIGGLLGALFGFLAWIIVLVVIGSTSMVTLINSALDGICNSGWMLSSFFNSDGGILTLFITLGLFVLVAVGSIAGALAGFYTSRHKK
jgi:hypothetical protein